MRRSKNFKVPGNPEKLGKRGNNKDMKDLIIILVIFIFGMIGGWILH